MDDVRIASLLEKFFKFFELLLRKCGPIPPLERIFQKEITFISIYERYSNNVEDEFPLKNTRFTFSLSNIFLLENTMTHLILILKLKFVLVAKKFI